MIEEYGEFLAQFVILIKTKRVCVKQILNVTYQEIRKKCL